MSVARHEVTRDYFAHLYRHAPLGVLTDVDGTLVPFAEHPEDVTTPDELRELLDALGVAQGVTLAIVSGRGRDDLDRLFPPPRRGVLFAEHGAWRDVGQGWEPTTGFDAEALTSLLGLLAPVLREFPAARVERKSSSLAIHMRPLPVAEKGGFLSRLTSEIAPWFDENPAFERLWGSEVLEVRPRGVTKAIAVAWMRDHLGPGCRLLVLGDDLTDEDMFVASLSGDASVLVAPTRTRTTAARWSVADISAVHTLFRDLVRIRRDATERPGLVPTRATTSRPREPRPGHRLLVVSNRLPDFSPADDDSKRSRNVGGLVSALLPLLDGSSAAPESYGTTSDRPPSASSAEAGGIWLGWSGKLKHHPSPVAELREVGGFHAASLDLSEDEYRHYYVGFANSALWPALHTFPARIRLSHDDFRAYVLENDAFAHAATELVNQNATIWAHDYHLMLFAKYARARGHTGKLGHFLHVPFPGPDVFLLLPWADQILDAMLEFDLLGFHTHAYAQNFLHCVSRRLGATIDGYRVTSSSGRSSRIDVFPLGVSPFDLESGEAADDAEIANLKAALGDTMLVLGVDRLDYTKGISERIEAFGRLLELHPEWRRKVCLVQVSVPSREEIGEYSDERVRIENQVGRINGLFGEADWVPIRYLYRSYDKTELAQLYRAADVGCVTPLRDGMNLVAKEFVAAQDETDPGVLLLSRFAGAAEELTDALLTNPWDVDGVVADLDRALSMPHAERVRRHQSSHEAISAHTTVDWAAAFLAALEGSEPGARDPNAVSRTYPRPAPALQGTALRHT